jgi:hypothetical protein
MNYIHDPIIIPRGYSAMLRSANIICAPIAAKILRNNIALFMSYTIIYSCIRTLYLAVYDNIKFWLFGLRDVQIWDLRASFKVVHTAHPMLLSSI